MNKFEIARRLEVLAIELDLLKREIVKLEDPKSGPKWATERDNKDWKIAAENCQNNKSTKDAPPYLNQQNYHNAIATINDHPWNPRSFDDYKRYHRLKGRVIATMQKEGRTSVPLKGAEPEWDLGMEGSKGPSCCGD